MVIKLKKRLRDNQVTTRMRGAVAIAMTSLPGLKTERGLQSKTKNFAEVKFAH